MNNLGIKLEKVNSGRLIDGSKKVGRDYVVYVNEKFDVKNRNDLQDLIQELNYQLGRDGMGLLEMNNRLEQELWRLEIGRVIDIRID